MSVSACAKARAETAPDGPPLEVPAPPARVLGPLDDPLPATAVAPETPAPAAARPPARPPARRPAGATAEGDARPEAGPPAPAAVQPPPEPAPAETLQLRAAPNVAAAERNVRDLLTRASRDINRVDYGRLSTGGRSQYDQAKRFAQQAEQALKERNYVFAATLADKAATLAAELLR